MFTRYLWGGGYKITQDDQVISEVKNMCLFSDVRGCEKGPVMGLLFTGISNIFINGLQLKWIPEVMVFISL